jgi:CysZ protein
MSDLTRGMRDVGRGFGFLNQHPRLWGWIIAPAGVSLLLLVALGIAIARVLSSVVASVAGWLPSWLEGVASWGLSVLVIVALGAAAMFLFVTLAGLIAGPFCELLSEQVEAELTGHAAPPFSIVQFAADAVTGIAHALRRLLSAAIGAACLFLLSMIPVAGTIAAVVIGGWFAARATAYDSYDAVLARRGLTYRDKLAFLDTHRSRTIGLGATVAALLLVPGVNLVALGIGAVGATLAAHELRSDAKPR